MPPEPAKQFQQPFSQPLGGAEQRAWLSGFYGGTDSQSVVAYAHGRELSGATSTAFGPWLPVRIASCSYSLPAPTNRQKQVARMFGREMDCLLDRLELDSIERIHPRIRITVVLGEVAAGNLES